MLRKVEGISFTFFGAEDVVRHPLVQRIVTAYEAYEQANPPSPYGDRGRDKDESEPPRP